LKAKELVLSNYKKEILAIVLVIYKWRPYILRQLFRIKTGL
jgi:hypothetical protein